MKDLSKSDEVAGRIDQDMKDAEARRAANADDASGQVDSLKALVGTAEREGSRYAGVTAVQAPNRPKAR